jgi:multiple sugar transport system permease protein/raffinose/stachyose/melibiose transport system permease protein
MASDLTETEAAVDTTSSAPQQGRRRRSARSSDRRTVLLMAGIPSVLHVGLVWLPAAATILLSFTNWNGFALDGIDWVGFKNYQQLFTVFEKDLYEALLNNLWVVLLLFIIATPLGMFLAYLMDKNLRGTAVYQSVFYFPVVLSLAVVGFIWKSVIYSPRQGLLNTALGRTEEGNQIDWLGDPDFVIGLTDDYGLSKNFVAMMIPMIWRHAGYIMVLYLAGLKSVDPALKEAAAIDGCSEWQTFRRVTFPSLKPVNVVIVVITVIEALRIFDIIDVLNNPIGTDVLSILVTESILGESSNIGRGSAYGVILLLLCLVFVVWYLRNTFREEEA